MKKENQIEEKIKELIWNNGLKIIFTLGFLTGAVLVSLL